MQKSGGGTLLQMGGDRPGLPYLKPQKHVTSLSDVAARVHVGDSANAPRQIFPVPRFVPANGLNFTQPLVHVFRTNDTPRMSQGKKV